MSARASKTKKAEKSPGARSARGERARARLKEAALAVLAAVGYVPNVEQTPEGFFAAGHDLLQATASTLDGVYLAGGAAVALGLKQAGRLVEQIGQSLGLSRERVRQLEARALKKLRDTMPAQRLHPVLEP